MRQLITFGALLIILMSGCNYSIYQVNKGNGGIDKKESYQVIYRTAIPDHTDAKITYISNGNSKVVLNHVTGQWEKSAEYKSGEEMLFKIDVKLPAAVPHKKLSTSITINGKVFSEYIQTGKNIRYRVKFKLP